MSDERRIRGVPMDAPHGREVVPAAEHRLHGADRSGLGGKGWSEVDEDLIGHPDDTNVPSEYFEPMPARRKD